MTHMQNFMGVNKNIIDIEEYLPFSANADIFAFCTNDDKLLSQKREALMWHVYSVVDMTDLAAFKNSLTAALFHPTYLGKHLWPHAK